MAAARLDKVMAVKHLGFVWIFWWYCPHLPLLPSLLFAKFMHFCGLLAERKWKNLHLVSESWKPAFWGSRNDSKLGTSTNPCKAPFHFRDSKVDSPSCNKKITEEKSRKNRHSWPVPRKMTPAPPTALSLYVLSVRYGRNYMHPRLSGEWKSKINTVQSWETGKGKARRSHDTVVHPDRQGWRSHKNLFHRLP